MGKNLILLLVGLFGLVGCASTHIFIRNNPEVLYKKYSSILVIANVPGMAFQTQLEDGLSDVLYQEEGIGNKFYQRNHESFQITPLTTKQIEKICDKYSCDAVIFIGMDTPKSRDYNIDLGSTTKGNINPDSFGGYTFTSRTMGQNISGTITTFNASVDLVDCASGKIAWHSEENVSTGSLGNWDQAIDSFLKTVAEGLKQNSALSE